jgi:hypothetical protein
LTLPAGVLERRMEWREYDGSRFSLRTQRLGSLDFRHLAPSAPVHRIRKSR